MVIRGEGEEEGGGVFEGILEERTRGNRSTHKEVVGEGK